MGGHDEDIMRADRLLEELARYPFVRWERDRDELRQAQDGASSRGAGQGSEVWVGETADPVGCRGVFAGGALVDGLPRPLSKRAQREALRWAGLAAECWREGGAEALRRHHHRRMEDLLIAWCDELTALGQEAAVVRALAVLGEQQKLAPALALLEASIDEPTWFRLDRRRRQAGAAWSELTRRWRIHHAFVTGRLGGAPRPPDDARFPDDSRPATPGSLPSPPPLRLAKGRVGGAGRRSTCPPPPYGQRSGRCLFESVERRC